MSNAGSLDGIRVIDFTQGLCGPFCTMQLGDAGAEVIKIEPPAGDFARRMGPPFVGRVSAVFLSLNRNKKSVVLDLETALGRETAARLARHADVVVEDFGPGAAEKIGLAYAQLNGANSKLVYCAISPFGEDGPLRDRPGAELVVQALAEYTASLGRIGDPPVRVGADVASLNTGIFAAQAVLAALFHRLRTGEGQRVAVSEFGALLHLRGIMWHSMSDPDDWFGFHLDHYTKPPDYGYQTKNGPLYFILRRGSSEDWDRLIMELGMEHVLADPRFADYGRAATSIGRYATEVKPIWEKAFANRTREDLIDLIKSVGGDAVPMMDYPSLLAHPQVAALEIITEIKIGDAPNVTPTHSPSPDPSTANVPAADSPSSNPSTAHVPATNSPSSDRPTSGNAPTDGSPSSNSSVLNVSTNTSLSSGHSTANVPAPSSPSSDHSNAGSFRTVRPVARFSDTPDSIRLPPPTLGQHTDEVLRALDRPR